jgi:hypothetical protein
MSIPGDIGYTCKLGLFCGLREQEILYIKEKPTCNQAYGCDVKNFMLLTAKIMV